jgi:selenium metabolism protein YedF
MESIDCKGLACPQPVLRTKSLIDSHPDQKQFAVTVDNAASAENVLKFLKSQGFAATLETNNGDFTVQGTRAEETSDQSVVPDADTHTEKTLVLITSDRIGSGDDELGAGLMFNFISTLNEMGDALWRLIFVNSGVKLTIMDAKTLSVLQELENHGTSILVCGTCLTHFNLLDQKAVGETTNMLDVVTSLQLAEKVITV